MRKMRIMGIVVAVVLALSISASALTTVFSSQTVYSGGVTIRQTKCVNSSGTNVSAIYYLYNTAGDYSSKTLTGGTTNNPAIGTLTPKYGYSGTAHSLYVEKGSGVTLKFTYNIN